VFKQAKDAYGVVDVGERDRVTRRLLEVLEEEKGRASRDPILGVHEASKSESTG
jgi:hypothetical protein